MKCEKMPPGGQRTIGRHVVISLCAACTGCITRALQVRRSASSLPRRCLHGVHLFSRQPGFKIEIFASALPARGASPQEPGAPEMAHALPRRYLHGVHLVGAVSVSTYTGFASALPARGASPDGRCCGAVWRLCLGATCTGCIRGVCVCVRDTQTLPRRYLHGVHQGVLNTFSAEVGFASALPARGASIPAARCIP